MKTNFIFDVTKQKNDNRHNNENEVIKLDEYKLNYWFKNFIGYFTIYKGNNLDILVGMNAKVVTIRLVAVSKKFNNYDDKKLICTVEHECDGDQIRWLDVLTQCVNKLNQDGIEY